MRHLRLGLASALLAWLVFSQVGTVPINASSTSVYSESLTGLSPTTTPSPQPSLQPPLQPSLALSAASLPPIPTGLPPYFSFGLFNGDPAVLPSGVPLDMRYTYLAGGANTGSGWATWNANGGYAANYFSASRARGLIPGFVYYQILQSAPNYSEFSNLQNPSTMYAYYNDFKLLMQKAGQDGGTALVQIEPDLEGVMQQHSTNTSDDASLQPTSVSSSGHPDVQGIPNTFRGYYQALAHLRDLYAPKVLLGPSISPWGASQDISLVRDPSYNWQNHATRTAKYTNSFGPGFQLLFYSPSDRDSAWYQFVRNQNRWWDETNTTLPNFNRMAEWMGMIITQTNKRAMMWQVPIGNRIYDTENNTDGHYQDNRAEYFLNPSTGRAHMAQWANYGFLGMMFGSGVGSQTHYFDFKHDGITNPAAINGNNAVSSYADDDGGYLRKQIAAYFAAGKMPLPGSGTSPTPTPSPTPTATNTPPATATPAPTNTPGPLPSATPSPTPPVRAVSRVYADSLTGWRDLSWGARVNYASTAYVHSGGDSIAYAVTAGWGALSLVPTGGSFSTTAYTHIRFYINGGSASNQRLGLALQTLKGWGPRVHINDYIAEGSIAASRWRLVDVPLSVLSAQNATVTRLNLQDISAGSQPTVYIDDVQFYHN